MTDRVAPIWPGHRAHQATVSAVVRDLLDDGVVEELGLSTAGGVGKPATLVGIDADGRHILCLDLSEPARFVEAIVNLGGKVVVRAPTTAGQDRTQRRDARARICRELLVNADRPCSASASPARASSTPPASSSPPPTSAGRTCRWR